MATMAEQSVEQELRKAVGRHRSRADAAKEAERERDRAIYNAIEAGVTYRRAAEIAGLSQQRIEQIRKAGRSWRTGKIG